MTAIDLVETDDVTYEDEELGAPRPSRRSRLMAAAGGAVLLGCLLTDLLLSGHATPPRPAAAPNAAAAASERLAAASHHHAPVSGPVTAPVLRAAIDEHGCPLSRDCTVTVAHDRRIQAALVRNLPGAVIDRLELTRDSRTGSRYRVLLSARLRSGISLEVIAQRPLAGPPRVTPWTELALGGGTPPTFAESDLLVRGLSVHVELAMTSPRYAFLPVAAAQRFVTAVWG